MFSKNITTCNDGKGNINNIIDLSTTIKSIEKEIKINKDGKELNELKQKITNFEIIKIEGNLY